MFGQQIPGTLQRIPNEQLSGFNFGYGPYKSVIICMHQNSKTFLSFWVLAAKLLCTVSANMSLTTLPTSIAGAHAS